MIRGTADLGVVSGYGDRVRDCDCDIKLVIKHHGHGGGVSKGARDGGELGWGV